MCFFDGNAFYNLPELNHFVTRSWSNRAAAASENPCVPAPTGDVYFNSAPVLGESFPFGYPAVNASGVGIPPGKSKTIDLNLFSDSSAEGNWQVQVQTVSQFLMFGPATLQLSLDSASGQNGDVLHLTIAVPAATQPALDYFVVTSTNGGDKHIWVGMVDETSD